MEADLGAVLAHLGRCWGLSCSVKGLGCFRVVLGNLGAILGHLGATLVVPVKSLRLLVTILWPCWAILALLLAILAHLVP